jgi:hypothetical protein
VQLALQLLQQHQHDAVHKAHEHVLDVLEVAGRLKREVEPAKVLLAVHQRQHHDAGHHLLAADEDVRGRLHARLQAESEGRNTRWQENCQSSVNQ